MKINTKNTIKVLSGLALVSAVAGVTTNTADAKTYKPEVRYDNGKYFVKTSDESAKGKILSFHINQKSTEYPYYIYNIVRDYKNQEIEIEKENIETTTGEVLTENRTIAIQDTEKEYPDREFTEKAEYEKKIKEYYAETAAGAITIKDAMKKETASKPEEAPQSPLVEKPKTEPKETTQPKPQDGPKTEPQSKPEEAPQSSPSDKPEGESKETPQPRPQDGLKTEPQSKSEEKTNVEPELKPLGDLDGKPQQKSQEDSNRKTEESSSVNIQSKSQELEQQGSGLNIFGQNKNSKKEDESKKQESVTLTKFDTKVVSKESVKNLANTGLNTSSYALLVSVVGLLGVIALRRKNR